MDVCEVAIAYRRAGLCVLPAIPDEKRPALSSWKAYQTRLPTEAEVSRWFGEREAICLLCGAASGNLEMIDFDLAGEAFEPWYQRVASARSALLERLVIEQSPSSGWHVAYRCRSPVSGNLKLAQRKQVVEGQDGVVIHGKTYRPRKDAGGTWHVILTLIETRGEGGLFLCAPTPGYELVQGDFTELPVLTEAERELLLEAAWSLNEYVPEPVDYSKSTSDPSEGRPGDDFNQRGDVHAVLSRHGWTLVKAGENEYWRRPGKTSGWSATLKEGLFYVFSTSASPFKEDRAYSPFAVYALLEHGGDYAAAASALHTQGFGVNSAATTGVDLSRIVGTTNSAAEPEREVGPEDPGPIPNRCFEFRASSPRSWTCAWKRPPIPTRR